MQPTIIRSSSLPRFMQCNGFTDFLGLPETESDAAKEGTAFHELVEFKFKNGTEIASMPAAKNGVNFDEDMHFYAHKILPLIPSDAICEQEISFALTHNYAVVGHLDYTWEENGGDTLVIMDIKYGHRIVEVENNYQLLSYAIGEMMKRGRNYENIKLMIIQPRPYHIDGWVRSVTVKPTELERAYAAMVDKCQQPKQFSTSDKCRYCPGAASHCPALNIAFYNSVDFTMNDTMGEALTPDQAAQMLKTYERVKDIFKIKMDALKDQVKDRIMKGEAIPGYGVQKQYGHRKWRKDVDVDAFKLMTGVDLKATYTMSPAEIEKKGIDESIIDAFAEKPFKGIDLVQIDQSKLADKIFGNN